ncbi:MAG: twin-arginine translocase subunit TatC [Candidatus Poseidoniaceae archaeon]|jgi:sec-independent protein translocase protein TatC|nr:twin-arginine translocase subunit TatC [Candidatus Poseidoniaceae archaeon]
MSEGELIDPSIRNAINSITKQIRSRAKIIAGIFVLGLMIGVPLSKLFVDWLLGYDLLPEDVSIIVMSPIEFIMIQFRAGAWLGFGLAILTLLIEAAWKSGISQKIPRPGQTTVITLIFIIILAFGGFWYSWELLTPMILDYLATDAQDAGLTTEWRLNSFVGFIINLCVACIIGFQAPIATILAIRSGILKRNTIVAYRRHIWFATFVLAAIFSPPDILSLFLVACPIILLFELALIWDYIRGETEDEDV